MSVSFSAATTPNFKAFLQETAALLQHEIQSLIPNAEPRDFLYDLMRDYPARGGKSFRGALVLLSCELAGFSIEKALPTALAFELFHNFALIHDDIEDESLMRRGKPALHHLHGIPLAINAGDRMHSMVYEVLMQNEAILGASGALKLMQYFMEVMNRTFEGQALDIGWVVHEQFPSRQDYEQMISCKTGWYSGKGPCQAGAIIAGASESFIENIGRFGEAIGIGFQIRDDLLNLLASSETEAPSGATGGYGKERGGDIAEGKRTLITIELMERLPEAEAQKLDTILRKPREHVTEAEVEWSIAQAESTGALAAVTEYCQHYANIAQQCLNTFPEHPAKPLLQELLAYLTIERNA